MAGGKGVFVASGYMTITVTPDLGKSWTTFSLRSFKNDPSRKPLVTHHVKTIYTGDTTGRFLALGDDRSKENPKFGNLFASDDLGKTWKWLSGKGLEKAKGRATIVSNRKIIMLYDQLSSTAFTSKDGGETWEGPFDPGVTRVTPSVVNGEFWLTGKKSRRSKDGKTWEDLPETVPEGKVIATHKGTLINIDRKRFTILRSADQGKTWEEVYQFEPATEHVHGAQGLRDITIGYVNAQ
jgi:photosystem II stability/assembly factor-like uncharacterized protein